MDSPHQPAQGKVFRTIALIALGVTFGITACLAVIFWQQNREPDEISQPDQSLASSVPAPQEQPQQEMVSPSLSDAWSTQKIYYVNPVIEEPRPAGSKAIDWGAQFTDTDRACMIGRNGLQGNPPVDPPSSKGRAYGYQ